MSNKTSLTVSGILSLMAVVLIVGTASAAVMRGGQTRGERPLGIMPTSTPPSGPINGMPNQGFGIAGKVTGINGAIITLSGQHGVSENSASTEIVYTVDAGSATIKKFTTSTSHTKSIDTAILVSDINVGDTLMVQGTVSGTSVTAKTIIVGGFGGQGIDRPTSTQFKNGDNRNPDINPSDVPIKVDNQEQLAPTKSVGFWFRIKNFFKKIF